MFEDTIHPTDEIPRHRKNIDTRLGTRIAPGSPGTATRKENIVIEIEIVIVIVIVIEVDTTIRTVMFLVAATIEAPVAPTRAHPHLSIPQMMAITTMPTTDLDLADPITL